MSRISRHEAYLQIAEVISKRSTCARGANGCVIIDILHNIPLAMTYNGSEGGHDHCNPRDCNWKDIREKPCSHAVHAEENALRKVGNIKKKVDIYLTSSPCLTCTQRLISSKLEIYRMYFRHLYHTVDHLKILGVSGVYLYQVTPLYMIDYFTGEVVEGCKYN